MSFVRQRQVPSFPHIKSQAIFCVSDFVDAFLKQGFDLPLRGRPSDRGHAGKPAAISTSGGRLAVFTRRFVFAIAHLSKDAIRVAVIDKAIEFVVGY